MAKATLTISSKNYSSWSLRGWLLTRFSGLEFDEIVTAPDDASARAEILLLSSSILVPVPFYAVYRASKAAVSALNDTLRVELAPFAIHSQCFALAEGERVAYRFTATRPVAFNVHFREGNARIIPVDVQATLAEAGDFNADQRQNYCLEWEAGAAGSVIDYRVQQVRPRR